MSETSLRIRFFESQGWQYLPSSQDGELEPNYKWMSPDKRFHNSLPAIDSNTVREAWMKLTLEEKRKNAKWLLAKIEVDTGWAIEVILLDTIEKTLDQEPTTLAELICEVRGVE